MSRLIVSVSDLERRLTRWVERAGGEAETGAKVVHQRPELQADYVGPRNEIERRLAEVWSQVLGITPVGVHDNFFELGGHSLLAMKIINFIRSEFAIKISMNALLKSPTVEQMASWIAAEVAAASPGSAVTAIQPPAELPSVQVQLDEQHVSGGPEPHAKAPAAPILVEIKSTGSCEPFFLVHPAAGMVYGYSDIARFLPDYPLYGLQAQGLEDDLDAIANIEDMARLYIHEIQQRQPRGPYYLGGECMGGCIAYEIAQLLHQSGKEVRFVALLDTPGPGQLPYVFRDDAEFFVFLFEKDLPLSVEHLRGLTFEEQAQHIIGKLHERFPDAAATIGEAQVRRFLKVYKANTDALFSYVPRQHRGPAQVAFFRAETRDRYNPPNPEIPWRNVCPSMELHEVPGTHRTMTLMPNAKILAERLASALERVRCLSETRP